MWGGLPHEEKKSDCHRVNPGIIHLVRTQYFPKNKYLLPPDTHTHVCVSGVRNVSFLEDFTYVLNKWFLNHMT